MRADYGEADFQRAVSLVAAEVRPDRLFERLGLEWEHLARLARGAAEEVIEPSPGRERGVADGAEAFTAGFLIGAYLPEHATDGRRGSMLPHAVDHVKSRGRHGVIADHCDLEAVARFEQLYPCRR